MVREVGVRRGHRRAEARLRLAVGGAAAEAEDRGDSDRERDAEDRGDDERLEAGEATFATEVVPDPLKHVRSPSADRSNDTDIVDRGRSGNPEWGDIGSSDARRVDPARESPGKRSRRSAVSPDAVERARRHDREERREG